MLPSGDCSLRITLAATGATINNTTMQNVLTLLAILMAVAVRWVLYRAHCPMEEVQGFHKSH
jgi:hypothetical protein